MYHRNSVSIFQKDTKYSEKSLKMNMLVAVATKFGIKKR